MKKILSLFILLGSFMGLSAQVDPAVSLKDPAQFKKEIQNKKVQLVDVRTPKEFKAGAIKNADNIDFLADGFVEKFTNYDKTKPIYIYCRSGNRSGQAAKKLSKAGFEHIVDLKGGYLAWEAFPKEKE